MTPYRFILGLAVMSAIPLGTAGVVLFLGLTSAPFEMPIASAQPPAHVTALSASRPVLTATECRFALRGTSAYSHDDDIAKMEKDPLIDGRFANWLTPPTRKDRYRIRQTAVFWSTALKQYETVEFFCYQRSSRRIADTARTPPAGY